jgi:branched-chain amino acid transport system permease protein
LGGALLTFLPEGLRAVSSIPGLSPQLSKFLADSRLIIFGILIALGTVFFPQGLLNPAMFRRRRPDVEQKAITPADSAITTQP